MMDPLNRDLRTKTTEGRGGTRTTSADTAQGMIRLGATGLRTGRAAPAGSLYPPLSKDTINLQRPPFVLSRPSRHSESLNITKIPQFTNTNRNALGIGWATFFMAVIEVNAVAVDEDLGHDAAD
ncbi:hypothetical protein J6590_039381 [Homalodisca vitripennis]|nr:hypothetical protein J6590_039381 [Homalodisca vitripennis]